MRLEDWPERLNTYLSAPHKFDWSEHNCALFAADAVMEITGKDYAVAYRGLKNKALILRKLKRAGGLNGVLTSYLGEPVPVLTARRGDVVLMSVFLNPTGANAEAVGICTGKDVALLTKSGITYYPLCEGKLAWRII